MSTSRKNLANVQIPDYAITIFFFLAGCAFSIYIFFSVKNVNAFMEGFSDLLIFSLYYLWLKAIIVDIQRIANNTKQMRYFPGFVFWVYASQWIIYWMIHDMAYSSAQLSSALNGHTSTLISLYLLNNSLFWLILDGVSSVLLFPFRFLFTQDKTIGTFLMLDYLKFLLIFAVFGLLNFL